MSNQDKSKNDKGLRVIKTARDHNSINKAARAGYKPLVKKVEQSPKLHSKFCVMQNKNTGEIKVVGDFREQLGSSDYNDFISVIGWTDYYPYNFASPYAAYLIPKDIEEGERVFVEDLIEDYVGATWNQGDNYRLASCEAIWNGTDLLIQYNPRVNTRFYIG